MRIGRSVRTQRPKDAVRGASPRRLRKKRRAAAKAKCHSDRMESAAYMRRVANRRTAAHDCNAAQKSPEWRIIMRTVYAQKNKKIILGRQGEDKAVRVVWPGIVSDWSSLYGDGSFQLSVRRFGDVNAYPVVVEVDGDDIRFTVTSAETAIAGNGKCELTYIANGTIAKSATWETVVLNSLTGQTPSEPPEEPAKSWFTAIQGQIGNLAELATTSKDNLVSAINEAAQSGGGGGASVALDTTLTQSGKAADAKAVGDALAEKQPKGDYITKNELPDMTAYRTAKAQDVIDAGKQDTLIQSGASVGQVAKITAVDDTGKPTAWQAVDMPNGGGHWETVLDTVWQQDVINPTAYDAETGVFTCAAGELDNLELNTEYAFYSQCTKEGIAYNTILKIEDMLLTKLSDTTFSIDATPPTTFVPTNVKFSKGACLAVTDIDAKKIRLTLDGQFRPTATLYDRPFFGTEVPYFGRNTGYMQIRNAYQAYQQVTAEVESPYRIVGQILCGFHAPSQNGNYHFKHNSFCCPLVPYYMSEGNTRPYFWNADGTKIAKLYSSRSPWSTVAISNDNLKIISGTKVKLERWVE